MNYNEVKQHGTLDFPFELYKLSDPSHPRYEMAMHWHSSLELIRVISGELHVSLDNRKYLGYAGDIFFVNSETVHGAQPINCEYECIVFNLAFMKTNNSICNSFIDELLNKSAFVTERVEDATVKQYINDLFEIMNAESEGYRFKVFSAVFGMLGEIINRAAYSGTLPTFGEKVEKNVHKLKRALTYIRENFDKDITLSDMANASGLSTKYFCAFFKQMTEKTPVEYLNMYRVERAARKLIGSDMSITEIAYTTGFNDLSYFIKTFKEFKKCTPRAYRKAAN